MMEVINVLKLLADHPEGSFLDLVKFNTHNFGTCQITGVSPVGKCIQIQTSSFALFFYIIEGTVEITLLQDEGKHYTASVSSTFVVPEGVWHRPGAPGGAKFIYFTPGRSLYSESDDPRADNPRADNPRADNPRAEAL